MSAREALAGALLGLARRCVPAMAVEAQAVAAVAGARAQREWDELRDTTSDLSHIRELLAPPGRPPRVPHPVGDRVAPAVRRLLQDLDRKDLAIAKLIEQAANPEGYATPPACPRDHASPGTGTDPYLRAENARQRATLLRYEELLVVCRDRHGGYDRREWLRILAGEPEPGELACRT